MHVTTYNLAVCLCANRVVEMEPSAQEVHKTETPSGTNVNLCEKNLSSLNKAFLMSRKLTFLLSVGELSDVPDNREASASSWLAQLWLKAASLVCSVFELS